MVRSRVRVNCQAGDFSHRYPSVLPQTGGSQNGVSYSSSRAIPWECLRNTDLGEPTQPVDQNLGPRSKHSCLDHPICDRDVCDEVSQLRNNSREFCESCLGYICSSAQSFPVYISDDPLLLLYSLSFSLPLFSAISFSLSCISSVYLCFYSLISPR